MLHDYYVMAYNMFNCEVTLVKNFYFEMKSGMQDMNSMKLVIPGNFIS